MFFDRLQEICRQRKTTPTAAALAIGKSKSVVTRWRNGQEPALSDVIKLAEHLQVDMSELIGTEKQETKTAPALTKRDERDIARALESFMQDLSNAEMLMFDGDPLSEEAKESIIAAMRLGMEAAKLKNKEKYTPKKYRKNKS